jgi:hypothetical protein
VPETEEAQRIVVELDRGYVRDVFRAMLKTHEGTDDLTHTLTI